MLNYQRVILYQMMWFLAMFWWSFDVNGGFHLLGMGAYFAGESFQSSLSSAIGWGKWIYLVVLDCFSGGVFLEFDDGEVKIEWVEKKSYECRQAAKLLDSLCSRGTTTERGGYGTERDALKQTEEDGLLTSVDVWDKGTLIYQGYQEIYHPKVRWGFNWFNPQKFSEHVWEVLIRNPWGNRAVPLKLSNKTHVFQINIIMINPLFSPIDHRFPYIYIHIHMCIKVYILYILYI